MLKSCAGVNSVHLYLNLLEHPKPRYVVCIRFTLDGDEVDPAVRTLCFLEILSCRAGIEHRWGGREQRKKMILHWVGLGERHAYKTSSILRLVSLHTNSSLHCSGLSQIRKLPCTCLPISPGIRGKERRVEAYLSRTYHSYLTQRAYFGEYRSKSIHTSWIYLHTK